MSFKAGHPVKDALEVLDKSYAAHWTRLRKEDLSRPSKERLVAYKLMGRRAPREGQLGLLCDGSSVGGAFIFYQGYWRLVTRSKSGKHSLGKRK